jgi:Nickel/cobalt transporter regulator
MRRMFAIAAIFALAVPTMAIAQGNGQGRGRPVVHGPAVGGPAVRGPAVRGPAVRGPAVRGPAFRGPAVRGPAVRGPAVRGPVVGGRVGPGGPHGAFMFHGHPYAWHRVHFARPWVYPPGYGYRLWAVGAILPPLFWAANSPYYYGGWADLGLPPPDPGYQYIQYGPDLLLVNVATGEVVQVFPGAFY